MIATKIGAFPIGSVITKSVTNVSPNARPVHPAIPKSGMQRRRSRRSRRGTGERNRVAAELEVGVLHRLAARADDVDARSPRSRACARRRATAGCRRSRPETARRRAERLEREGAAPPRASRCRALGPGSARPSHEPVSTVARRSAKSFARSDWTPIGRPSRNATRLECPVVGLPAHAGRRGGARRIPRRSPASPAASVHGDLERHRARDRGCRLARQLGELAQLGGRRKPQLEPRRAHAQPRQRRRRPQEEVPLGDDVEAELRVELARPVVGERLEEHALAAACALLERVLRRRRGRARGRDALRAC